MAERFFQEALVRKSEVNTKEVPSYIAKVMMKIDSNRSLDNQFAEEVLVYSTLIENYVTKNLMRGDLAYDVRTYFSLCRPQELELYRSILLTV